MKGMFLLSTLFHAAFFALMVYLPSLTHKEIVYTPVYTVDLLSLPKPAPKPKPKPKVAKPKPKPKPPKPKPKPLEFTPPKRDEDLLKKLEQFEKEIKKTEKPKEKKEIKESSLSDMLTQFEKKWEEEEPKEVLEDTPPEEEEQEDILEKLSKLEEKWKQPEEELEDEPETETSEENSKLTLDKQIKLRQTKLESQVSEPVVPTYLNRYYAVILSRIHDNWADPLSTSLKEESEREVPGVAYFEVLQNGEITNITIDESSGNELLDSLIKKAIKAASPLPPPPKEVTGRSLNVYLDFRYMLQR